MVAKRTCIVCGKPIAKATTTVYFKDAESFRREPGSREESYGGQQVELFVTERPRTKSEAQRYLNQPIVSIRRSGEFVYSAGIWDGESFTNQYFHSNECAILQGIASARGGHRYTWKYD